MTQPKESAYRYIPLNQGKFTKVSAHRFEFLNQWQWSFTRRGYAARYQPTPEGRNITILMHRVIMDAKKGERVDHADRDPLNNIDDNLRFATAAQNAFNRKKRSDSKQPYKGVSLGRYGRWRAEIQVNGVRLFLGQFATAEEARDVREEAATKLHGGFASDGMNCASAVSHEIIPAKRAGSRKGPRPVRPEIEQPDDPSIRYIPLTKGQVAIISAHRYEEISKFYWYALWNPDRQCYYALRCEYKDGKQRAIWLHKVIAGVTHGIVDHINGKTLDCTDDNLRSATKQQNNANNRLRRDNKSGYKGVSFSSSTLKWQAQTNINGRPTHIGYFDSPEEAHAAYARVFKELHGDFACLG